MNANEGTNIGHVAVIGCGTMGLGIAGAAAGAGVPTVVIKATGGEIGPLQAQHAARLEEQVQKGHLLEEERHRALANLTWSTEYAACASADLVVESVREDAAIKESVLKAAAQAAPGHAVFASNTSTLALSTLAAFSPRPERFVGLHFFNPVQAMPLVEVAGHAGTEPAALELASAFARRLGKTPVLVTGSPGYVVNRLLVPYLLHAVELFASRLASAQDIDRCLQLGCAMPIGPLALCDLVGNDVVLAMARTLQKEHHQGRFRPPGILGRMVASGHTGRKAGRGFYDYAAQPPGENPALEKLRQA